MNQNNQTMKNQNHESQGAGRRLVWRIVAGRAYTVMDSLMTAYERGDAVFNSPNDPEMTHSKNPK